MNFKSIQLHDTFCERAIFLITASVYLTLSIFFSHPAGMSITNGDEPHYLIAAHSLYYDHDFDMRNNYDYAIYQAFTDIKEIDSHLYNFKGRTITVHPMLGVPLLIMLPYAWAGRIGVLVWLSVLMASSLIFLYRAIRVYASTKLSFAIMLFCGLTYPVIIYSHQIYPDTLAFAIVAFTLAQIMAPSTNERMTALWVGIGLGLLPHFHFRFALLSMTLYPFFLLRVRDQWVTRFKWSIGPILVLTACFVGWIYHLYGEFSPDVFTAPTWGMYTNGRFGGLAGLWFDQEYGLVFFAPLYLMAVVGCWRLWRNPATRTNALFLTLIYAVHHLSNGLFHRWDGGLSPVPRYLIPVLPVLIILAAKGIADYVRERQWVHLIVLGFAQLWITRLILLVHRPFMFGYEVGSNTILRDHYHWDKFAAYLPTFKAGPRAGSLSSYLSLIGLLLLLALLWRCGAWVNRRFFASDTLAT